MSILVLVGLTAAVLTLAALRLARRSRPLDRPVADPDDVGAQIAADCAAGRIVPGAVHPQLHALIAQHDGAALRSLRPWLTAYGWFGGRLEQAEAFATEPDPEDPPPQRNWRSVVAGRGLRAVLVLLGAGLGAVLVEPALEAMQVDDRVRPVIALLAASVFTVLMALAFRINGAVRVDLGRDDLDEAERRMLERRRRWVWAVVALALPALAATAVCREHNTRVTARIEATPVFDPCALRGTPDVAATTSGGPVALRKATPATPACSARASATPPAPSGWSWWLGCLEIPILAVIALAESLSGATAAAGAERRRRRRARRHRRLSVAGLLTDLSYRQIDYQAQRSRATLAARLAEVDAAYLRHSTQSPPVPLAVPADVTGPDAAAHFAARAVTPPDVVAGLRVHAADPPPPALAGPPPKFPWPPGAFSGAPGYRAAHEHTHQPTGRTS